MRRILSFVVLAAMLLASSCSLKEDFKGNDSGFAQVSFTIGGPEASATRAIGDGTSVNMLYYSVYSVFDGTVELIPELSVALPDQKFPARVDITLAKGQTYKIAFWAQNQSTGAYSVLNGNDLREISISYDGLNNDENRDAFFKTIDHTVSGDIALDVTLERPFAQINLGATQKDWSDAEKAGIQVNQSKVTISNAATKLNVFDGKVSDGVEVNYLISDIPTETLTVEGVDYKYLSMSYMLVADMGATANKDGMFGTESSLVNAQFELATTKAPVQVKVDNLPVQRNWRTNVLGTMLTGDITFNIHIDPIFDGDVDNYPDNQVESLYFAGLNGGTVVLKGDVVLDEGSIEVYKDMVVDLNGFAIRNLTDGDYCNVFVAYEGANLVIKDTKGTGVVETEASSKYAIPVWARGGKISIYGGSYYSNGKGNNGSEVVYASGKGQVTINGGLFQAKEQSSDVSNQWLALNCHDASYRNGTANIVVKGGSYYKFNPANNLSEGANTNFVVDGYVSRQDGDYWNVSADGPDYVLEQDYIEVYSAEGLLKWAYILQQNNKFKAIIKNDINLPAFTVEADDANETYKFTSTPIDVVGGIPTGSNWINYFDYDKAVAGVYFQGEIEGGNNVIRGLRLVGHSSFTGLVGYMRGNGVVKDLIFEDAVVYSAYGTTGVAVGNSQDGSLIENVHVRNSSVKGTEHVGGVVGRNYTRGNNNYKEELSVVRNCTADANTVVSGTSSSIGGICGNNYGALIVGCINSADVTGYSSVGGVVGYTRDYHHNCDGFVLASATTAEATITATSSSGVVGGIAGTALKDTGHTNSNIYIVGCYSTSTISGKKQGSVVGQSNSADIYGSWGLGSNVIGTGAYLSLNGVTTYLTESEVLQSDVDAMNAAIAAFNAKNETTLIDAILVQCPATWSFVAGSYPIF